MSAGQPTAGSIQHLFPKQAWHETKISSAYVSFLPYSPPQTKFIFPVSLFREPFEYIGIEGDSLSYYNNS